MEFKKYGSIENHYRQQYIDKMLHFLPEAGECDWVALEKLDGANIQIVISPDAEMRIGKRSGFLEKNESFFDIWQTLEGYSYELDILHRAAKLYNTTYRFYGEIYGPGINGRVDYGRAKRIALFDCEANDVLMNHKQLEEFFYARDMNHFLPKKLAEGKLLDVLQVNVEIGNCEGAVIKPLNDNFFNQDSRFIIKKKSEAFNDKEKNGNELPARENVNIVSYNLNIEFRKYINDNRVLDVFAKHGKIERPQQIPDYIKLILEDAKVDFLKDNKLPTEFTSKEEKDVFNVGGIIVGYLKKHL